VLGIARVEKDERPVGGRRELSELALVGRVALLIDQQRRGTVSEGRRGEQPPGARRLARARAAADPHMPTLPEREPRTLVTGGRHYHVLDLSRPGALVDDLGLRSDPPTLAVGELHRRLPPPAALELVAAELLARTEIRQPPPPPGPNRRDPRDTERNEHGQDQPQTEQRRREEQHRARHRGGIGIADREGAVAAQPPRPDGAGGGEHKRREQ